MMKRAINQYKNVSVESALEGASSYEITKKLFEGCLVFLKQAKIAIDKKDYEKKAFHISRSEAIITTLASSLDKSEDLEVAENLERLYDFCLNQLIEASIEMNSEKVLSAEYVMRQIKEGWESIPAEEVLKAELLRKSRQQDKVASGDV